MYTNRGCQVVAIPTPFARAAGCVRVAEIQAMQDWNGWRAQVAQYAVAIGGDCLLSHVTVDEWRAHYEADTDPYTAVLDELQRTEH